MSCLENKIEEVSSDILDFEDKLETAKQAKCKLQDQLEIANKIVDAKTKEEK